MKLYQIPVIFSAIVIKKNCLMNNFYALNINNQSINSENCVKLLEIEIENTQSLTNIIVLFAKKQAINEMR